jgi:hypothetical protein
MSASISPSPSEGYTDYSRGAYSVLPINDNELDTMYTEDEYINAQTADGHFVSQIGTQDYMVHEFKSFGGEGDTCSLTFEGKSTLAPSQSTVYLQIYNRLTQLWETVASEAAFLANRNFLLSANIKHLSKYKDAQKIVSCRVYQLAI